jgi:phosphoribosylformylglycinamidine synthase
MGEFVECVEGIGEACEYLKFPVVSGNVSFYNQTKEVGIKPTPAIGGVGLIKDYNQMITMDFKEINNLVLIIGKTEGHLDQSLFARSILDEKNGPPPEINLFNEKNNGETLLQLIDNNLIRSAHDISLGGIATAISKMCIKSNKGFEFNKMNHLMSEIEYLFSEDQGRYIIEINPKNFKKVTEILEKNSVHFDELGKIIDNYMIVNQMTKVTIDELKSYNKNWLDNYMSS